MLGLPYLLPLVIAAVSAHLCSRCKAGTLRIPSTSGWPICREGDNVYPGCIRDLRGEKASTFGIVAQIFEPDQMISKTSQYAQKFRERTATLFERVGGQLH